jgi:cystathionine gamma-synthase
MPGPGSFDSKCAHVGEAEVIATMPVAPPLYLTSVFETPDLAAAGRAMDGEPGQYIYSRNANPTVAAFERAVSVLDGGEAAVAFASGMGAISTLFLSLLKPGDAVVASDDLYGSTAILLAGPLAGLGVSVTTADPGDPGAVEAALTPSTRLIFVETVSNPLMRVADVPALADVAKRHGCALAVDASFTSPALSRPLAQGADFVVHSATKYLGGHSDLTAGVAVGRREMMERLRQSRTLYGPPCSPLDAWLALRGMKTLALRMARHTSNGAHVAGFLCAHAKVRRVYYPGLNGDPSHAIASRVLPHGSGGMLSFEVDGGAPAVDRFISGLSMVRFAASLADVTTTLSHPASTSHRGLTPERRAELGIGDGLVRLSVGIESPDDICADLEQGLAAV